MVSTEGGRKGKDWYLSICTARVPKGLMIQEVTPDGSAMVILRLCKDIDVGHAMMSRPPRALEVAGKWGLGICRSLGKSTLKVGRQASTLCQTLLLFRFDSQLLIRGCADRGLRPQDAVPLLVHSTMRRLPIATINWRKPLQCLNLSRPALGTQRPILIY